jgi:Domain of unknown function (DUF4442)
MLELGLSLPSTVEEATRWVQFWKPLPETTPETSAASLAGQIVSKLVSATVVVGGAASVVALSIAGNCFRRARARGKFDIPVELFKEFDRYGSFGRFLFSKFVVFFSPGSAWPKPLFLRATANSVEAQITQRRAIENPFNSIHFAALMNAGEVTQGVGILSEVRELGLRGIVKSCRGEFIQKARGTVTLRYNGQVPPDTNGEFEGETVVLNSRDETVARVWVTWHISPNTAR